MDKGGYTTHIQNSKYWEFNFLTSVFKVGNSQKIYQNEGF